MDGPLRSLVARMARDARMADAVSLDPASAPRGLGLTPLDLELLGVVAAARAAYRLDAGRGPRAAGSLGGVTRPPGAPA